MKLSACLFAIALLAASASAQIKTTPLTGTWQVTAFTTTGPNGRTVTSPQPGLFIFTGTHYSTLRVTSDQPRIDPKDPAHATPAELLAVFGPLVANAGTYEVSGGTLTAHPLVAKTSAGMAPGVTIVASFKIVGNTMTLTDVSTQNGPFANPSTYTLTRIE